MNDRLHFRKALLLHYEEEVMGEASFAELTHHVVEDGAERKLRLPAAVERRAAESVRPHIERYEPASRETSVLAALGRTPVAAHWDLSWREFVSCMAERYPAYMNEFEGLERMAPAKDLPALAFPTAHENAAIEFANSELPGRADSADPLLEYIDRPMVA